MMKLLKSNKKETLVFLIFIVGNTLPLFFVRYFASLDGPQHLYVSNIIAQLISGNELFKEIYSFNPLIIGNILGNYLLGLFNVFLPAWVAEKILLIIILLTFTGGFGFLVKTITGKLDYLALLIIPFSYHALFMLGYYNFSLALGLLFISLGLWQKIKDKFRLKWLLLMVITSLLTFYAHLVVFAFMLLILGIYTLYESLLKTIETKRAPIKYLFTRALILFLINLPGIILGFMYFRMVPGTEASSGGVDIIERLTYLWKLEILVGFVHEEELIYTRTIFFTILSLFIIALAYRLKFLRRDWQEDNNIKKSNQINDFWLFLAFVLLGLFLILPDHMSLPKRVLILIIPIAILWISAQKIPNVIRILTLVVTIFCTVSLRVIHLKYLKPLDNEIREVQHIENLIPENSIILTANYSQNWVKYHISHYIGIEKPLPDINSPAISELYAVSWNEINRPFLFIGTRNASEISTIYQNKQTLRSTMISELIIITGYQNFLKADSTDKLKKLISNEFELHHLSLDMRIAIYKFNKSQCIEEFKQFITERPGAVRNIEQKAAEYNIPFESALLRDAIWLCDQANQNQTDQINDQKMN